MLPLLPVGTAAVSVLLTTCMFVQPSRAQIGSDCSDTEPCTGDQECSLGYCRCPQGFVKRSRECLPEASYNETCEVDDQCTDFRLKCVDWRCTCVKYYHWDEYSRQCLTFKDLKYMLNDMNEKYHTFGEIDAQTSLVFTLMMWTGLAVMVIGLVLASGCIFYGCCYGRLCCCPSKKLSNSRLISGPTYRGQEMITPNTSRPTQITNSGRTQRPATQGTGVDYIPALYETTSFDVI